jgi:hypothetical protein
MINEKFSYAHLVALNDRREVLASAAIAVCGLHIPRSGMQEVKKAFGVYSPQRPITALFLEG